MQPDMKPIFFDAPAEFDEIEIYPIHDLHYGNQQFNMDKWKKLKAEILSQPNRYCVMVGDMMEMAIPNSKSDMFYQTVPPEAQKEWVAYEMGELANRIIASDKLYKIILCPRNHTEKRIKTVGFYL